VRVIKCSGVVTTEEEEVRNGERKGTRGKKKMDNKQTAFTLVQVDVIPNDHPIKT